MEFNANQKVIDAFGDEWQKFDQSAVSQKELVNIFNAYFAVFPWEMINKNSIGFDLGCGSGRWAKLVAPRVGKLYCIDPSAAALKVARQNLAEFSNCEFYQTGVDSIPLEDNYADFGYALGVLHHIPDTEAGIKSCVSKLKKGAPFLLYLYYAFDNRPWWFRMIWLASEPFRVLISRTPFKVRYLLSQIMAIIIYYPLARFSWLLEKIGVSVENFPLSAYRQRSFYTMRTDALDRFGTRLEKRFTKNEIQTMMENAGLERIVFTDSRPYWGAVGYKT